MRRFFLYSHKSQLALNSWSKTWRKGVICWMEESRKINVRIVRKYETKSTMKCLLRRIRFARLLSRIWICSFSHSNFCERKLIRPKSSHHMSLSCFVLETSTANFLCLEVIVTQLQVNLFCRKFSLPSHRHRHSGEQLLQQRELSKFV